MVARYVEKWEALEVADQVKKFRDLVRDTIREQWGIDEETSPEAKLIRSWLHSYTIAIRQGRTVDIEDLVGEIRQLIRN